MTHIKKILLATDFSEGSAGAADMARTLATMAGAEVVVLHVVTELSDKQSRHLPSEVVATLTREVERHAVEDMHRFCDRHFKELPHVTEIVNGRASAKILEIAKATGVDLIVMGTHGRTGLEKLFVGSTAEKVVKTSGIPVLTVRE